MSTSRFVSACAAAFLLLVGCDYFLDTTRPEVRFISPGDGDTVLLRVGVRIEAADANLELVVLLVDGVKAADYRTGAISDTVELPVGTHLFEVQAFDKGGNRSESRVGVTVAPRQVALDYPPDSTGYWCSDSISLGWVSVPEAVTYQVQVDNGLDFVSPVEDEGVDSTGYCWHPGSQRGMHFWHVRAGVSGVWGPWSSAGVVCIVPYESGFCDTPGYAFGVAVSGNYAYVADGSAGLRVIDVTDPWKPAEAGFCDTLGNARGVAVAGNYACVANGDRGLRVIDVTDPQNPAEAGLCDTPSYAYGVAVSGNYAYVADWNAGLRVIDVSDPQNPHEVGYCDTPGYAYGVTVAGNYAYVADYSAGLRVIDVSDPQSPAEVGFCDTPGTAIGVAVAGNYAYVADGDGGLRVIDVTDPQNPAEAGFCDTPGDAYSVAVAGNCAYVADWNAGLRVIRVAP